MNHSQRPIILSGTTESLSNVILSAATASQSEAVAESKDLAFISRCKRTDAKSRSAQCTLLALLMLLLLSTLAAAQTLTGVVKNATTGKPGAGDEVILITLGNGMEEAGRTKADSKGNFSFKLEQQGPHLVRVIHQEVTYHRMAPPGTTSVEVEVNDVGKSVEGIEVVADIMRFQAQQGTVAD